jgi:hypothetical protein
LMSVHQKRMFRAIARSMSFPPSLPDAINQPTGLLSMSNAQSRKQQTLPCPLEVQPSSVALPLQALPIIVIFPPENIEPLSGSTSCVEFGSTDHSGIGHGPAM